MIATERVELTSLGGSTRVLRQGTGAPVLLLHGSPDSADEWRPVMAALGAADCACYAPDLPGLGACDEPADSYDFSRTAGSAYVDELLDRLGITEPVVLVVHDIGGVLGIGWAAANPDRVRGLVITNTVVFEDFRWFALARVWSRRGLLGRTAAAALMWQIGWFRGRLFRRFFARISPELGAVDLDRITHDFACDPKSKRATVRLFRTMVPAAFFAEFDGMVRDLVANVPVRVVWGGGDPYIPQRYADRFAPAPTDLIEDAGHWVPVSAPDQVATAITALLPGPAAESATQPDGHGAR